MLTMLTTSALGGPNKGGHISKCLPVWLPGHHTMGVFCCGGCGFQLSVFYGLFRFVVPAVTRRHGTNGARACSLGRPGRLRLQRREYSAWQPWPR